MRLDEYNRILIPYATLVPAVWTKATHDNLKRYHKINTVGRGGRGNTVEIVYDTMSDHYKDKVKAVLGDPRKVLGLASDRETKAPADRIPFESLTPTQLRTCGAKYNLVKAFREYAQVNGGEIGKVAAKHEFISLYDAGHLCQHEREILSAVSFQSMERWNKDLREGGEIMDALAPAKRDNVQAISVTPEQQQQLISLYLDRNQPTITAVYRKACREWKYKHITDIPQESAVRRFLKKWKDEHNDIVTLHREGEKAFKEKCMPYIERDPEKLQYMDCWVSDGRVMNFQIVNPTTGKLCRPTMIAWMDMRTLQFLGFELVINESTMGVASAFRAACINAGRLMGLDCAVTPRSVYIDNGRAFKNKTLGMGGKKEVAALAKIKGETAGLFERLKPYGLEHVQYAKPYNARPKTIERVWQLFDELDRWTTTYVGNNIENKPANLMRNEVFHKAQWAKELDAKGYPTLWGAYDMITWFLGEYNNRAGNGKYLKGFTPMELAAKQTRTLDLAGRTIETTKLDYMLMHEKVTKITANGVRIKGVSYYNTEFTRVAGSGREYIVRYDLRDRSRVLIYNEDGTFWCEATTYAGADIHPMAALGSDIDRARYHRALGLQENITKQARARAIAAKENTSVYAALPNTETLALPPVPNIQLPTPPVDEAPKFRLF